MVEDQLVASLDQPAVREALAVVFDRTDGGTEAVEWEDVADAVSMDQWERLIESGHLESAAGGFALAEPELVRTRLEDDGDREPDLAEIESRSWSRYDKAAGLFTLVLFAGYWNTGLRDLIASVDDVLLAPITGLLPFYEVIVVLAVVTGLYSTVLQDRLMDRETMQAYRERMERIDARKEAAKERDDEAALERIQEEQMEAASDQLGMFKLQFRPMVWIMLLTIPVFLWLRWKVRGGHLAAGQTGMVVPLEGATTWQQSLLGPMPTWIVWYFVCSMAARQLIRKSLGVGYDADD